jgi:uncharacterized protein (DUF58 family)
MRPVPTRRLAAVVAASALLLLLVPSDAGSAFVALEGVLVGLVLLDLLLAVPPGQIEVERETPGALTLGVPATISWQLTNHSGRRVHVRLADELAPSLRARARRASVALPARGSAVVRVEIIPARRGRFHPTEVVVRTEGPLRLAARQRARSVPGVLRVFPPFRSRQEAELLIERARILEIGLRSAKGRGGGTEFDQLREYTTDDDYRRIDWAATARTGRPIVRTYRAERNQTVVCLLDNGRVMAGRVAGVPRVEHAMDAVMMLTTVATRLGDRVGLVAFDRVLRSVVVPSNRRSQLGLVAEAMYTLEPALTESDYRSAFTETLSRFRRRTMIVIFTDLVEQAVGESLLPALPLIVREHVVVIVAVRDPDVAQWAAQPPRDGEEAYRRAAAASALEERRRTVARLQGMGARVIDAVPGQVAQELADAYLTVKATGRL